MQEQATVTGSEDYRAIDGNLSHEPPAVDPPDGYRASGPWEPYAAYSFSQARGGGSTERLHVVRWRRPLEAT